MDEKIRELREHFGDLLDEKTLRLLAEYSMGKKPSLKRRVFVEGVVVGIKNNTLTLRSGNRLVDVAVKTDLTDRFKVGYRIKCFSEVLEDEDDFEVIGDVKKSMKGVFLGGSFGRFALAVDNSVWTCIGNVDCERGDLIEVTGFNAEDVFVVLDYKKIGKAEIPNLWTEISSIIPLKTVNVRGRVSGFSDVKVVKGVDLAEISVSDSSGRIRVLLWGENAKAYRVLDIGDEVELYNCYAKISYDGEIELHCGRGSVIIKLF